MKKALSTLIAIALAINFSNAQTSYWLANVGSDIYNTNSSGNVGIGTASPAAKLDVNGNINTNAGVTIGGTYPNLNFSSTGWSTDVAYIQSNVTTTAAGGGNYLAFVNPAGRGFSFVQNGTSLFNLSSVTGNAAFSGSVGIGTAAASQLLSVGSGNPFTVNSSGYVTAPSFTDGYTTFNGAQINRPSGYVELQYNTGQAVRVGGGAAANLIVNGYVGIGTATPDQMLSVAGTIHSKEVLVDLSGWPDFVFKPKYHLLTLPEVKTYIDKNHHLPDVPSEAEVVKNGLNVGNMERTLTKKVEELTLYLIEKDKQVKIQEDINRKQELRLKKLEAALNALKRHTEKN